MKSWMYLAAMPPVVVLGGIIAFWMAKHGAPQQAWLFCHVMKALMKNGPEFIGGP